jgi:hypothetical protein
VCCVHCVLYISNGGIWTVLPVTDSLVLIVPDAQHARHEHHAHTMHSTRTSCALCTHHWHAQHVHAMHTTHTTHATYTTHTRGLQTMQTILEHTLKPRKQPQQVPSHIHGTSMWYYYMVLLYANQVHRHPSPVAVPALRKLAVSGRCGHQQHRADPAFWSAQAS